MYQGSSPYYGYPHGVQQILQNGHNPGFPPITSFNDPVQFMIAQTMANIMKVQQKKRNRRKYRGGGISLDNNEWKREVERLRREMKERERRLVDEIRGLKEVILMQDRSPNSGSRMIRKNPSKIKLAPLESSINLHSSSYSPSKSVRRSQVIPHQIRQSHNTQSNAYNVSDAAVYKSVPPVPSRPHLDDKAKDFTVVPKPAERDNVSKAHPSRAVVGRRSLSVISNKKTIPVKNTQAPQPKTIVNGQRSKNHKRYLGILRFSVMAFYYSKEIEKKSKIRFESIKRFYSNNMEIIVSRTTKIIFDIVKPILLEITAPLEDEDDELDLHPEDIREPRNFKVAVVDDELIVEYT